MRTQQAEAGGAAAPGGGGAPPGESGPPEGPSRPPSSQSANLAKLLVGVAVVVGLFLAFGQGVLLLFIVAILVIVMLHELGHFVTAKWSRMKVTEYFVGFGPRLWSFRRGETEYGVKAIPAGGYVKIPGMTNLEQIDPEDEPRTYRRQPFHKRIVVACAGSSVHFLLAFLLAFSSVLAFGAVSSSAVQIAGFVQWPGHERNAAQIGGLRAGDTVVSVAGHRVTDPAQLSSAIKASPGKPVAVVVRRDGRDVHLTVTPAVGHVLADGSEQLGSGSGKPVGIIGVSISQVPVFTAEGPFRALGSAATQVASTTSATVAGLGHVFSPHGLASLADQVTNPQAAQRAANNPVSSNRVMSLVGAGRIAVEAEHQGVPFFLDVLISLNIVIALVNMIPMLPLDGGHVAIAVYERLRTRRGRPYYQADAGKLLPVAWVFMAVLGVVVISAMFLDIAHPVSLH